MNRAYRIFVRTRGLEEYLIDAASEGEARRKWREQDASLRLKSAETFDCEIESIREESEDE